MQLGPDLGNMWQAKRKVSGMSYFWQLDYVLSLVDYNERQNVVSNLSPIITTNYLREKTWAWSIIQLKQTVTFEKPCNWTCKCPILSQAYISQELNCNRNEICDAKKAKKQKKKNQKTLHTCDYNIHSNLLLSLFIIE